MTAMLTFAGVASSVLMLLQSRSKHRVDSITQLIGVCPQHPQSDFSDESVARAVAFEPRTSDVFILTAPKTGTTWLQQICHQIRMRGGDDSMDFADIYQVAPWPQMAWDLDIDVNAEQPANPRIFKTHQRLKSINRGGKYIVTVRDPTKTIISWFAFLTAKGVPPVLKYESVSRFASDEDFVVRTMRFGATLWEYYTEFWQCRALPNVLVLVFEELLADLPSQLPRIAAFLGVPPLSASELANVARKCGKACMLEHGAKFDESWAHQRLLQVGRVKDPSKYVPAPRVTQGHSHAMDAEAAAFLAEQWRVHVFAHTGLASYEEMANALRAGQ